MYPNKSPDRDSFNPSFFQIFCDVCGNDWYLEGSNVVVLEGFLLRQILIRQTYISNSEEW
jgi:hypothetical protein